MVLTSSSLVRLERTTQSPLTSANERTGRTLRDGPGGGGASGSGGLAASTGGGTGVVTPTGVHAAGTHASKIAACQAFICAP